MALPSVQTLMLKGVLALPRPILRGLSGGGVVYVGGRTLDPQVQFLASQGRAVAALSTLTPEEARVSAAASLASVRPRLEPGVAVEPQTVSGPGGDLRLRVYRPEDQDPMTPVMVFAHFGGGVIGDLDTCEVFCAILAKVTGGPVVSADYRLAPENRFPDGLDDVLFAYRWARDNAGDLGAPPHRASIGGDAMGGNFAAVVAQEMKRAGEPQPDLQLLIYPALDVASEAPSMATYADAYPLSRDTMEWFMGHYMGPEASPADPRASPLRAADLSGLAPAVIATAGFDPLLDHGEAYAKRLRQAGVMVTYRCYDHLAHAFTAFTGVVPAADRACREIAGLVKTQLETS